jgi:EpsI family protein
MTKKDNTFYIIIACFLIAGTISWNLYFKVYRQEDTVSIHDFPKDIAGWTSTELPITDREKAVLETDNVFARRYTNERGEEVTLFIVYSQNNRKVSHPPEVCYTGSGSTILSNVHDSFTAITASGNIDIDVNHVTVEKGSERQIFLYWFKVGDSFTTNYWKQQGLIALKSFLGQPSSSALIRISASIENGQEPNAKQRLKDFGGIILPYIYKHLP